MIHLSIPARYQAHKFERILRKAAKAALRHHNAANAELTLALMGDAGLRSLNRRFRGEDKATDVLSFPGEGGYLGDIAISVPHARAQARAGGHSLAAELQLLAVHGVLHLLGHDHARPAQRRTMWAAQDAILQQLRLPLRSAQAEARP